MMEELKKSRPQKIRIGVITQNTGIYKINVPLFRQIIKPDIDDYVNKLPPYRFYPSLEFEFLIEDAQGDAEVHLEKVQSFHDQGVNLIIGGSTSSQAASSLQYVNHNDMLLFSHTSTSSKLSIEGDNLFRMCPDNHDLARAMAEMISSKGIKAIIVLNVDNMLGNDLHDALKTAYEGKGGVVHARLQYSPGENEFTDLMYNAEIEAMNAVGGHGTNKVGVVLIGGGNRTIVHMAENYPSLYSLTWFGPEATGRSQRMLQENPEQACRLKLYSALTVPTYSSKFHDIKKRWETVIDHEFDYYAACKIDIAWVIAIAVLEIACSYQFPETSADVTVRAQDVIKIIPNVASRYFGYSGWCLLNKNGDRATGDYEIWGYGYDDETNEPISKLYGRYDSVTEQVTWFQPR